MNGNKFKFIILTLLASWFVSGCDVFDSEEDSKDKSKRISILRSDNSIVESVSRSSSGDINNIEMKLPTPLAADEWHQAGLTPAHVAGNLSSSFTEDYNIAEAGDDNGWRAGIIPAPVASKTAVFVIDSLGVISSHARDDIRNILWKNKDIEHKRSGLSGGGLAISGNILVAVNSHGEVAGLDINNGSLLWKRNLRTPVRSAPATLENMTIISTTRSETVAINNNTGAIIWRHKGIVENANILSYSTPAIYGNIVVTAYSSGEIHALHRITGNELWSDSLLRPKRVSALDNFTGVAGNPVIFRNYVFAAGSNGVIAANFLNNGLRVWEHKASSYNNLWLAGNFLFVITSDNYLAGIHAPDGRVKWASGLSDLFEDDGLRYYGPYLVNSRVVIISEKGELVQFDPIDGTEISRQKLPVDDSFSSPVILSDGIVMVDKSANLHFIK